MDTVPAPPEVALLPSASLAGRVALVTGGGTGIGLAIGLELARAGAAIVIASRDPARRARGVAAIEAIGGRAIDVTVDVREPAAIDAAFTLAEAAFGPVDILVNNAAANFYVAAERITPNGWDAVVDRVLKGSFFCSQEFARRLIAAELPGAILNIVVSTGIAGGPMVSHSAAAKAGVINLTRSLAAEWARDGIRVNALAPGIFPHGDDDPATAAGRLHFDADAGASVPVGRTGALHEVGYLAAFLCSPFAAFITGQTIVIDGGSNLPGALRAPPFVAPRDQLASLKP